MGSESAFVSRASERLARPAQLAAVGVNFTCVLYVGPLRSRSRPTCVFFLMYSTEYT